MSELGELSWAKAVPVERIRMRRNAGEALVNQGMFVVSAEENGSRASAG